MKLCNDYLKSFYHISEIDRLTYLNVNIFLKKAITTRGSKLYPRTLTVRVKNKFLADIKRKTK